MYEALAYLVHGITGDSKEHRLDISRATQLGDEAYIDTLRNLQALGVNEKDHQKQASVIALNKLLWSLLPVSIITSPDPDLKKTAIDVCKIELGIIDPTPELVSSLTLIFKRVRSFLRNGRSVTSLDLAKKEHARLMKEQNGRCAHCYYEFKGIDIDFMLDPGSDLSVDTVRYGEHDLIVSKMLRRPELDHIIPHFLGGDNPCNWQILCATCNSGKSHSLSWMLKSPWVGVTKVTDGDVLTASMRYMVLARDRRCCNSNCLQTEGSKELRVSKLNKGKMIYLENLTTMCQDCLVKQI